MYSKNGQYELIKDEFSRMDFFVHTTRGIVDAALSGGLSFCNRKNTRSRNTSSVKILNSEKI